MSAAEAAPPADLPGLSHVFTVRLDFGERYRFGPVPAGYNTGFVAVTGGTVSGQRLSGRVVPNSGGDWPVIWPDGTFEFDARYLIETTDGTLVYVQNRGIARASAEVQARIAAGLPVSMAENYFRTTPVFTVAAGPHDWLMRSIFVGLGDKHARHSLFHFYALA
jgi:hypothetical protein